MNYGDHYIIKYGARNAAWHIGRPPAWRPGIAKAAREGAVRKAENLKYWWGAVEYLYGARILPFVLAAAAIAGALSDRAKAEGQAPGFADIAIAATAAASGLVLLTRNRRHFESLCDVVIDPFVTPPE